jgi:hypothetical protein
MMLTTALFATALLLDGGQVAVIAGTPPPAEARPASAPPGPEGDTRRICRMERATGSNLQQRVCRDVPRAGVQDQQTREFMRSMQRMRMPDEGAMATPAGPNG